jgi:1-acyl-sn-glycerol-3-phosphate acyltransferase
MSDIMYRLVVFIGRPAFKVSSSPVILHRDRGNIPGAFILAPTHLSNYDVPCLMKESRRLLDFMSITELYRKPFVAWFFTSVNVFPLERSRPDAATVRIVLDRLARGRVVVMFPEGNIRKEADSVVNGGHIKPGVARLARLAGVPIVPCCILGTGAYSRPASWLPLRRTRFGISYGKPLWARKDLPDSEADLALVAEMKQAYRELYVELVQAMAEVRPSFWQRLIQGPRRHAAVGGK